MRPASVQRFYERRLEYANENEDSVLANLIPLLIRDQYMKKLDAQGEEYQRLKAEKSNQMARKAPQSIIDNEDEFVQRDWFSEGVKFKVNAEFKRDLLPNVYESGELGTALTKALSKSDGMLNPKPDYCFGLRKSVLDGLRPQGLIINGEISYILEVVSQMDHPFFIIEGKSNQGIVTDAENQARRGGATLVNAGRLLLAKTSDGPSFLAKEGADDRTFVFSATMTPHEISIFIHWAEVVSSPEQGHTGSSTTGADRSSPCRRTLYHMTYLDTMLLRQPKRLPEYRAILHNILEWGCVHRLPSLQKLRKDLLDWQIQKSAEASAEARHQSHSPRKRQKTASSQRVASQDEQPAADV